MHEGHISQLSQKKKQQLCPPAYSMNYNAILIVRSLQFHQAMKEMNDV